MRLGHKLFFDPRLSANGKVSCSTCHQPERNFTDGLPRSRGIGETPRKSMTVVGAAYSPFLFWDGRKDSLWAQALGPLENLDEHGFDRARVARLIGQHYRGPYEAVFGPLPDLAKGAEAGLVEDGKAGVFVNVGKAIAAYERRLLPGPARFDRYIEALLGGEDGAAILTPDELAGLKLFVGEAGCTNCQNGPLLTNHDFHNTGVPTVPNLPDDRGRALGAQQVLGDEFNCLSLYSDAEPDDCAELRFLKAEGHTLERAFKVSSLRNVAQSAPYMHAGQFATLRGVLEHYNDAPEAPAGQSELSPLGLTDTELKQLEAFLHSLSAPLATPATLLGAPRRTLNDRTAATSAARRAPGEF